MPGKSEAERNREEAHQNTHIHLRMAEESLRTALDWSRSWPNKIKKLDEDLLSMLTRLGTIITAVKPPDYVQDPGTIITTTGDKEFHLDEGDPPVIRIRDAQ